MKKNNINPGLGIAPDSPAANFLRADYEVISELWKELHNYARQEHIQDVSRDYSQNGSIVLAGRCLLPDAHVGAYWAVRDNRVHFSGFKDLSDRDKMVLANQVLIAYANRSEKDDLKSAALAVSQTGHFYIAMNTQELRTMDWDKECAESNVTRIVKQLSRTNDKIGRMYVLGGLTDGCGNMHIQDHLIGMCMRCVEIASAIMSVDAKVIVIPANDGKVGIALRECDSIDEVKPYEAWQTPYRKLKTPSIVQFPESVNAMQRGAFIKLKAGAIALPRRELTLDASAGEINAHMVAELAEAMRKREGEVDQLGIAVLEIMDNAGKRIRFQETMTIKGPRDNSTLPSINGAINQAALAIPGARSDLHVGRVYVMGFNADGSPYDISAEVGDRLLKRVGAERAKNVEVICIPLNEGAYPANDILRKTVRSLAPTTFPGSKQHGFRMSGEQRNQLAV